MRTSSLARALAKSFIAGEQTVEAISARATQMLGREWHWVRRLASRYLGAMSEGTRPRLADVLCFLKWDRGFHRAHRRLKSVLTIRTWSVESPRMQPVPAARNWDIPKIETIGDLCDWLWVDPTQLDWFADLKQLNARGDPKLSHYHYRALTKSDGSIRLIEAPKKHLKRIQRQILTEILDRIPAHAAAHGFVRDRSIHTFAAPHTGKHVVLRMDIRDFFPSFRASRIQTMFRTIGYPESVANALGGLCTNAAPHVNDLYAMRHLPQGAPTSPSLANICCYRIDCRLAGLAKSTGAEYTRYADDLAFSGGSEFERTLDRFIPYIAMILREEGLFVNHRKTRIMRRGVRQHVAGLTINEHLNIARRDFDQLKAILTNCIRTGPASQNRDGHPDFRAHIQGRIAFFESVNPTRATKLRHVFNKIRW